MGGGIFRCFPGPNQHISSQFFWFLAMPVQSRTLECIENDTPLHSLPCIRGSRCWTRIGRWELDLSLAKARIQVREVVPGENLDAAFAPIFYFWGAFRSSDSPATVAREEGKWRPPEEAPKSLYVATQTRDTCHVRNLSTSHLVLFAAKRSKQGTRCCHQLLRPRAYFSLLPSR